MKKNKSNIIILIVICIISVAILAFSFMEYKSARQSFNELKNEYAYSSIITLSQEHKYQYKQQAITDGDDSSEYLYEYEEDGILFLSETKLCDKGMLGLIAKELFSNTHGDEINLIKEVIVSGEENRELSSELSPSVISFTIPMHISNFLPAASAYTAQYERTNIYLFGFEEDMEIDDFAFNLSYTYGKYFTQYNFGLAGTDADKESEYYKLRTQDYSQVITDMNKFDGSETDKKWCLTEIAAYDYVYLLGSPTTKEVYRFYDSVIKNRMFLGLSNKNDFNNPYYKECRNGTPHINIVMDLPYEVEGLAEYYFSFTQEEPQSCTIVEPVGTLNLKMISASSNQHYFTWDQPYNEPGTYYTLIGYDMDDNVKVMVMTFLNLDSGDARLGNYSRKPDYYPNSEIYNFYYEFGAQMKFRISITFPDGTVVLSDPIVITY